MAVGVSVAVLPRCCQGPVVSRALHAARGLLFCVRVQLCCNNELRMRSSRRALLSCNRACETFPLHTPAAGIANVCGGQVQETGNYWSLGFVALAIVAVVGHCLLSYGFSVAGERLTHRLRDMGFK